jgi:uncharacterized Zn finger protein
MASNTLIKHKEVVMICEESGPIITKYNTLVTHLESKLITQPIITSTTSKLMLTCSNCGKFGHVKETYHNKKG